ncbi:MAG: hypothetical protein O2981_04150 [Proteobacteria bacterium]|nr:hypothetical protein [Pseudomonadota bacterium]
MGDGEDLLLLFLSGSVHLFMMRPLVAGRELAVREDQGFNTATDEIDPTLL